MEAMTWKSVRVGAAVGAAAGALFGLAVVLFGDCEGPDCVRQRIVGVLAHVALGVPVGAALGLAGGAARGRLGRLARRESREAPRR